MEITHCEVCGGTDLTPVLNLGPMPLSDDLKEIGDLTPCARYPIEILFCDMCKTAHHRYSVPKELLFPSEYHYRARQTKDVLDGMVQFVDSVEKHGLVKNLKVLDIGTNDGSLLNVFHERGAITFGVEPTSAALECEHPVRMGFFNAHTADWIRQEWGCPDIITFTNVFAHIEDLDGLIHALNRVKHSSTTIVIENHYLGSILEKHQFDTFYHEHPRTYSYTSFVHVAHALGMHVEWVEFPKRYGGNIRVFLKPGPHPGNLTYMATERDFQSRLIKLGSDVELWRQRKLDEIRDLVRQYGPLFAVAFPARAAILLNTLHADDSLIKAVCEKEGSNKIGYYVPGTNIPILSDKGMAGFMGHDVVLNLAWHIPNEVEARWREKGFHGRFIQIVDEGDFQ